MTAGRADLLRLLTPPRPAGPAAAPRPAAGSPDEFAAMLERARAGEIASGRIVRVDRRAGVELSEPQIARLSLAADRAEAAGAKRALVLIDGLALRLDVMAREVTARVDLGAGGVLTDIDAVLDASAAPEPPRTPPGPTAPAPPNPSLLRILREAEEKAA